MYVSCILYLLQSLFFILHGWILSGWAVYSKRINLAFYGKHHREYKGRQRETSSESSRVTGPAEMVGWTGWGDGHAGRNRCEGMEEWTGCSPDTF